MPPPPPPSRRRHLTLLTFLLHLSLLHATPPPYTHPDLAPLLSFKSSSDVDNRLSSWTTSPDPCNTTSTTAFHGVSCLHHRVTSLVLEDLNLHGGFTPLTSLVNLRVLSLKHNSLTGPIPNLSNLTSLKLVFLSYNQFSGEFPPELPDLFRLDLSHNNFSGDIPTTINRLTRLLTLRLEGNNFSGGVEFLKLPELMDFNISNNNFSGEIPGSLSGFQESGFLKNPILCGFPLSKCEKPKIPSEVVSSSPASSLPWTASVPEKSGNRHGGGGKMSTLAIVAIIIGDVLVLGLVSLLLYCYFCKAFAGRSLEGKTGGEKRVYTCQTPASYEKGKMVFFEGVRRFELEDLLKASAEMLGKGGLGTAYKAVLDDGSVVAVKRLKEVVGGGRFEQQMEVLGRLRHPNVVSLKAYYFAKEEKLLVYEYMNNGSLFWLLHGNRGPGRIPLNWSTRLKIALGAAKGLAFIHTSPTTPKLIHGNIKSTNILLDKSGNACIADTGLAAFTPPTPAPRSVGYHAPELSSMHNHKPTQRSDVYSFGVMLLELLTGKCPSVVDNGGSLDLPRWVQSVVREEWTAEVFDLELMSFKGIEEEMVRLLHIALSCASVAPDDRPEMVNVVKMIHDIEGVEMSPTHDLDSASCSPSVVEA